MKPKTMILMLLAVGCGLAASYMTSRLLAGRAAQPDTQAKVSILVAKKRLDMGTFIREPKELFTEKQFNAGEEPAKAIRSYDELKERVLNKTVNAEQWVCVDDMYTKDTAGIAALLPPGTRAMAIRVNPESIVGGFVLPLSRVDVICTVRQADQSFSQIILQNVKVVAVDQIATRDPERNSILGSTVTLAVKPEDGQKLTLAQSLGELRLVLRANDDNELVNSRMVRPSDVIQTGVPKQESDGGDDSPGTGGLAASLPDVPTPTGPYSPVTAPPLPPPPKKHTLVINNGEGVTKATYVLDGGEGPRIERSAPITPVTTTPPAAAPTTPAPAASEAGTTPPTVAPASNGGQSS